MYYIIQENTFREPNYQALMDAIHRLELEHEIVKVLPFLEDVEFQTQRQDVFVFGAIKLARLGTKYNWNPGSLLNQNHDYQSYAPHYGEHLLNSDSQIVKFADNFTWGKGLKFIRPCADNKVFTGKVFDKYQWDEFVQHSLTNGHSSSLNAETPIQVCGVKQIYKESRFWIVDGKVVTGSQYRLGNQVNYQREIDQDMYDFCQEMTDKFQLAKAFVMDICRTPEGLKIVECGCINSAGFYEADMQKLLMALEDCFG